MPERTIEEIYLDLAESGRFFQAQMGSGNGKTRSQIRVIAINDDLCIAASTSIRYCRSIFHFKVMAECSKGGGLPRQNGTTIEQPMVQLMVLQEQPHANPLMAQCLRRYGPISDHSLKLVIGLSEVVQNRSPENNRSQEISIGGVLKAE
jgi:hypothetical protein